MQISDKRYLRDILGFERFKLVAAQRATTKTRVSIRTNKSIPLDCPVFKELLKTFFM